MRIAHDGDIRAVMARFGLDALVLPLRLASWPAAMGGYPVVSVPLGFHPPGTPVERNSRGDMIESGPNVP